MDKKKTTARLEGPVGVRETAGSVRSGNSRRRSHSGGASRGFTLIEVLVAMVILVIGIFALIELFPPGFLTLQISAEDTAANNLARGELEQLTSNSANQLGGVYALYSTAAGVPISYDSIDDPDQHMRTDTSLGLTSDINAERAIQGETVRIPPAVSVAPESSPNGTPVQVSVYVPNFAPIQMPSTFVGYTIDSASGQYNGPSAQQLAEDNLTLKVSSTPWTAIEGDSNSSNSDYADPNAEPAGGEPQYLIDYNALEIAVGPEFNTAPSTASGYPTWYPQPFNFSVEDDSGNVYVAQFVWDPSQTTHGNDIQGYIWGAGKGAGCQWFPLNGAGVTWTENGSPVTTAPTSWLPGSAVLWRDFHLVYNPFLKANNNTYLTDYIANNGGSFTAAFGNDPYSYALMDPELGTSTTTPVSDTNLGVIAFSPAAAKIRDANGNPLMATINYSAADWHIIHEDHTLGETLGQNPTARLSLKDLYQLGQSLPDNSLYSGIVSGMANPSDFDVIDLDTGQATSDTASPASLRPTEVDYNNGVMTFPGAASGDHVRILYRASGDWGLAIIKAPSTYTQRAYAGGQAGDAPPPDTTATGQSVPGAGTAIPPVGTYEIEQSGGQTTTRLLFPGTDIGKLVRIGNILGSNGITYHDASVRTIQPDPTSTYDVVVNGNDVVEHLRGYVDLAATGTTIANPDGNLGVLPTSPAQVTISSVGSVSGVSITARVVWKDRTAWRYRDVTSLGNGTFVPSVTLTANPAEASGSTGTTGTTGNTTGSSTTTTGNSTTTTGTTGNTTGNSTTATGTTGTTGNSTGNATTSSTTGTNGNTGPATASTDTSTTGSGGG